MALLIQVSNQLERDVGYGQVAAGLGYIVSINDMYNKNHSPTNVHVFRM